MQRCNLKGLAAADIHAAELIVTTHHVRLRLCEPRPIPLIGLARQLGPLPAHNPGHFVLARLPAFGAGQIVRSCLRRLYEKFPLFHLPRFSTSAKEPVGQAVPDKASQINIPGASTLARLIPYSTLQ